MTRPFRVLDGGREQPPLDQRKNWTAVAMGATMIRLGRRISHTIAACEGPADGARCDVCPIPEAPHLTPEPGRKCNFADLTDALDDIAAHQLGDVRPDGDEW